MFLNLKQTNKKDDEHNRWRKIRIFKDWTRSFSIPRIWIFSKILIKKQRKDDYKKNLKKSNSRTCYSDKRGLSSAQRNKLIKTHIKAI